MDYHDGEIAKAPSSDPPVQESHRRSGQKAPAKNMVIGSKIYRKPSTKQ